MMLLIWKSFYICIVYSYIILEHVNKSSILIMLDQPCQWSRRLLAPEFPWRRSRIPPGDSWRRGGRPGSAPLSPPPAVIGWESLRRRGQRWPSGWWRRRRSRGRRSEKGKTWEWGALFQTNTLLSRTLTCKTDRQAVEDDVFMWWGRGARRQGNRAVIG